MNKLDPSPSVRRMLGFMFYQDAMDDHPDYATRFRHVFATGGYDKEKLLGFVVFLEKAIAPAVTDQELSDLFDDCHCEIGIDWGGHRYLLQMMLAELKGQV